jgi:hypothetical protein
MVMRNDLGQIRCFVGVDVSEAQLDVCLLPGSERAQFSRDRRGIARLIGWVASQACLAPRGTSVVAPERHASCLWSEPPAGWSGL